jgi:hypothetical protein
LPPDFPVGAVDYTRIQQVALDMIQSGLLNKKYTSVVDGTRLRARPQPGKSGFRPNDAGHRAG